MAAISTAPPNGWPALVLNADYRPLSYYPLSVWPWQDVVKAVFLERVDVVAASVIVATAGKWISIMVAASATMAWWRSLSS